MLSATNISVKLRKTNAINSVSVEFSESECVAIVGPNGSGKSTLLRSMAGLLRVGSGSIELDGRPIRAMPPRDRAYRIGLLTQGAPIPELTTVGEYVGLGRYARRSFLQQWTHADADVVRRAIETCQVDHLVDRRMDELSGGERQRVRIATLLAQEPQMLLLDEPLTGLDLQHQLALLDLLRSLHHEGGRSVVCVLHDLDLALRHFQRVVVLSQGKVHADGEPREVFSPELLDSVFGVRGYVTELPGSRPAIVVSEVSSSSFAP